METITLSEFVWGAVLGTIITTIGAVATVAATGFFQDRARKKTVALFCFYSIRTIRKIVDDMEANAERSKAIYHEFLGMLDVELSVVARNREHIIWLDESVRDDARKFFDDVTISKAKIASSLAAFYEADNHKITARAKGDLQTANGMEALAGQRLSEANSGLQRIAKIAQSAEPLCSRLQALTR